MADFQALLRSATGAQRDDLSDFFSLKYSLVEMGLGILEWTGPALHDPSLFIVDDVIVDQRLDVARRVATGPFLLEGEATWFIQTGQQLQGQERQTHLVAVHANDLLRRHIVAYAAGSAQADKAAMAADNAMKDVVDENYGAAATDVTRSLAAYLSIQGDLSAGASIAKAFARRIVLNVLQEYARASAAAGTYLSFDTVVVGGGLQFRTYTGQRGSDHRLVTGRPPLNIGPGFGNILNAKITFDHQPEVTYVYAGGLGVEAARVIGTASDATRIAASPFNRREQFIDSRTTDDPTQLADEADAALRAGIPRVTVTGELQDTSGFIYGRDYAWGDYLTLQVGGFAAACRLSSVTVSLERGREGIQESLTAVLKGEVN